MRSTIYPLAATLICLLAPTMARACEGQVGKTIFEDDFSDDSGGWTVYPPNTQIKDSSLQFGNFTKASTWVAPVPAFSVPEGDFCVDVVMPPVTKPDNYIHAGLGFWYQDANNFTNFFIAGKGTAGLSQEYNGTWNTLVPAAESAAFKSGASATNELRAVVKAGKITIYLNGTKLRTIRAQLPTGPQHFALYADIGAAEPGLPPIRFTHFKVTSGE